MAEELFCAKDTVVPMERWGEIDFEELLSSSLLERYRVDEEEEEEEAEEARYVMHDLVHDLAAWVSGNNCATMGRNLAEDISQTVRHISYHRPTNAQPTSDVIISNCEKLRTLLLLKPFDLVDNLDDVLENIVFRKLRRLRVLGLSSCPVKSVKASISQLKHLRYLDLSYTEIEELPESVCELNNLQLLNLFMCGKLKTLPVELGRLMNLMYLDVSGNSISNVPESLCKLCNLRVLNLASCRNIWRLPEGLGDLTNLRCLNLHYTGIEELPQSLGRLCNLQVLNLMRCRHLSQLPSNISGLVNLRHLLLRDERLYSSITRPGGMTSLQRLCTSAPLKELSHMNELRILILDGLSDKTIEDARQASLHSKTRLTSLELRFDWSRSEQVPCNDEAVLEGLRPYIPSLKTLKIFGYRGVRSPGWMVVPSIHKGFPLLQELVFADMARWEVEHWWGGDTTDHQGDERGQQQQPLPRILPCLRLLKFYICDSLRVLPSLPPTLKTLEITLCPELKWPSSASSSVNPLPEESQRGLLLSSSLVELRVPLSSDRDGDLGLSSLVAILKDLTSLRRLTFLPCLRLGRTNTEATVTMSLLTPPGEEVLKPLMSLETVDIKGCPGLVPSLIFQSVFFFFARSSSSPSSSSSFYPASRSESFVPELEFLGTPPQVISRQLREVAPGFPARSLSIFHCPELSSFGGDGDEEGESIIGRELEAALLGLAPSLSRLCLDICLHLKNLPSSLNRISSLRSLEIEFCPEIEALPDLPPALDSLSIYGCPELSRRCQRETGEDWPKISRISDVRIRRVFCLTEEEEEDIPDGR